MAKYKIVIIDDGWEVRRKAYEAVLGDAHFDFQYIRHGNELEMLKKSDAHGYILDMHLDGWKSGDNKEDLFLTAAKNIGKKAPVILISNKWNDEAVKWLNKSRTEINVVHFISWEDDINRIFGRLTPEVYVTPRFILKNELDKFYNREAEVVSPDETVNILHISDLQFGDEETDKNSVLLEGLIPKYLREKKIPIHLLIISGDIAYSGLPSQYEKAFNWFQKFCKELFSIENFKSRLLFIPGNHDVNLRLNAADKYDYDFKSLKLKEISVPTGKEHHFYGLIPFREFAYKITGNPIWMEGLNDLCFVNDRFLHWGVRFYHLNSVVEQCCDLPSKASIPVNCLENLNATKVPGELFKIIISHHGPYPFGLEKERFSDVAWIPIRNFITLNGINLFVHGHVHGFRTYFLDDGDDVKNRTQYHMTSTLTLDKKLRPGDGRRGFSLIELHRKEGLVKQTNIRNFEIVKEKISEASK